MNTTIAIGGGIAIGLATTAVILIGLLLLRRRATIGIPMRVASPIPASQQAAPPRPRAQIPATRSVPTVKRAASASNSALERHLRTAILSPDARERLLRDAMRKTGGDRNAAIRKVLDDLHAEDRRLS